MRSEKDSQVGLGCKEGYGVSNHFYNIYNQEDYIGFAPDSQEQVSGALYTCLFNLDSNPVWSSSVLAYPPKCLMCFFFFTILTDLVSSYILIVLPFTSGVVLATF